jgi:hypothetical protein
MMLVTLVFCVMAAAGSYLVRAVGGGDVPLRPVFIIFTLAAPALVVVALSLFRQFLRWLERSGRRR